MHGQAKLGMAWMLLAPRASILNHHPRKWMAARRGIGPLGLLYPPCSRGRRGTWWHGPSFCLAGVGLCDINLYFVWQAWDFVTTLPTSTLPVLMLARCMKLRHCKTNKQFQWKRALLPDACVRQRESHLLNRWKQSKIMNLTYVKPYVKAM